MCARSAMRLVSRKPPELRRSGCRMSAPAVDDEVLEPFAPREVLAHADRHLRALAQPPPRIGVVDRQRIFEPQRLDRLDRVGDLNRRAQVVFPVAVDHDVVVPADRLAAVLEPLLDVDQLSRRQHAVGRIARRDPSVRLVCGNPNLWEVKPLGCALTCAAHSLHEPLSSMFFGAA